MSWLPKKKVVIPTDFSQESFAAVDLALGLVKSPSHLHVVHILPELSPLDMHLVSGMYTAQKRRDHALESLRKRFGKAKYNKLNLEVLIGDAAPAIVKFAQDAKADLIVLPSHGRTGAARILIGSVAERVVRLAHCPVLVVRK